MVSTTGRLSTTLHLIPYCSIYSLRSRIFSRVHTSPSGTSCRAVTMPSTPICFSMARVILSFLPNHLQVLSIVFYYYRYIFQFKPRKDSVFFSFHLVFYY